MKKFKKSNNFLFLKPNKNNYYFFNKISLIYLVSLHNFNPIIEVGVGNGSVEKKGLPALISNVLLPVLLVGMSHVQREFLLRNLVDIGDLHVANSFAFQVFFCVGFEVAKNFYLAKVLELRLEKKFFFFLK